MDYFVGLDISIDETHVCVSTGKARSFTRARRRRRAQAIAGELAKAIKELGHDVPYGIDHLAVNTGWVSVGIDNDAKSGVSAESLAAQHFNRKFTKRY